jgi:hypothetical protein
MENRNVGKPGCSGPLHAGNRNAAGGMVLRTIRSQNLFTAYNKGINKATCEFGVAGYGSRTPEYRYVI